MFTNFLNIDELKKSQYKDIIYFDNNKKLYVYILYSNKELSENDNLKYVRHDLMSYGDNFSRVITNYQTLKYLALNQNKNNIQLKFIKNGMIETSNKLTSFCFVENKTKYFKLYWDIDFKYDSNPEIYYGFTDQHEIITKYILSYIIETLNETLHLKKSDLQYIWAQKEKSIGYHIYFPNIIVDKQLHLWIYDKTFDKIKNDKKYPVQLINKIFDSCIKSNGLRLFYYKYNNDYYFPLQEKSTYKFDPNPDKHFHLCILNTNFDLYNFNLKIDSQLIFKNEIVNDKKTKDINDNSSIVDIKTININDKKDLINGLSKCLSNDKIDDYKNWISMIYMFKNFGMYNEIVELSKKSKKFDSKSITIIDKIFKNKTTPRDIKIISLGTLIDWAKKDNLDLTNNIFAKYYLSIKLDISHIDEIIQSRFKINIDFLENSQHISEQAKKYFTNEIDKNINNPICFLLQSCTGSGKTTTINYINEYILNLNPHYTFLSVVTRRSMCACHISAFNHEKSKIKFTSYLDDSYDSLDYFISSLENLVRVHDNYDIVLLDEINSLINYFYSDTLKGIRLNCISSLLRILSKAKIIIACDANITDLVFSFFNQINIKYIYYKNTFMNKIGIPFNIHYCKSYDEKINLLSFCNKFINDKIKNNKSVLILTDSKTITDDLKDYFYKYNSNHDYFRIFNKDEGKLDDLININKICVNRCIISNTKIQYGIDIQYRYDEVFIIYRYASSYGIDPFCMNQQIGRPRHTEKINLLILDPKALYYTNSYISYEQNKNLQQKFINNYSNFHQELCKKYNFVNEMGAVEMKYNGSKSFNPNSIITDIHFIKTWYDTLFYNNKIDILKLIAEKSYGYKINCEDWIADCTDIGYGFYDKNIGLNKIVDVSKQIYLGEEDFIDEKYKYCIDNLREQITMREKYLHNIEDTSEYIELACNEKKFTQYIYNKYLSLSKEEFDKKIIETNNKDMLTIIKNDDMINKINTCFWFEKYLNIKRFAINDIQTNNLEDIKNTFNKNINNFYWIFKNRESKSKTIKSIKNKIDLINKLNNLQKFIAECYNYICDNTIKISTKRIKIKNNIVIIYLFN